MTDIFTKHPRPWHRSLRADDLFVDARGGHIRLGWAVGGLIVRAVNAYAASKVKPKRGGKKRKSLLQRGLDDIKHGRLHSHESVRKELGMPRRPKKKEKR